MAASKAENKTLLFLSKTTYDKRATENNLLGEKLFDVNDSEVQLTRQQRGDMTIYDTPAIMDTDEEADQVKRYIKQHTQNITYDAVVLVFRYPVRMTPEEIASIKIMIDVIGKKKVKKYGILIFTNGSSFLEEANPELAFQDYLKDEIRTRMKSSNKASFHCFGELIELITTERCMFINNEEVDDRKRDEKRRYFQGLVEKIGDRKKKPCCI